MKISVVIPIYNAEKYLVQCLDSVENQTYKNLEIICVNDASTDDSLGIIEQYAKKDERIKIISLSERVSAGIVRNIGSKNASGEYIHFLDSDDFLELDAYKKLVNYLLKSGNVDIIHFLWNNFDTVANTYYSHKYKNLSVLKQVVNIHKVSNIALNWNRSPWCKLYRRQFLVENNIEFNEYPCLEDIEHSIRVLVNAKSIYFVPDNLLNYRVNTPNSLMRSHYKYYDCAVKSYYTNLEICKNLDKKNCIQIFDIELCSLFSILYEAFYKKSVNLKEVRRIAKNIDLSIFNGNIRGKEWYLYYKDLVLRPSFVIILKQIIKVYFPSYYLFMVKFIKKIKSKEIFND